MGTCTSTARHRKKQQQEYNRLTTKNSINFDIRSPPPLPPLPLTAFPKQQIAPTQDFYRDFDILSTSSPLIIKPIFHQSDTNSLIQLYSSNTNNNNNNNDYMSSSMSTVTHIPPRIPAPKTRLPVYQSSQTQHSSTVNARPKTVPTAIPSNQTVPTRPISMTNRAPPPTTMQTRFGFIPRPNVPGAHQYRSSTVASRSRSISPTSTISAHSSSSSSIVTQRTKPPSSTTQIVPPSTATTMTTTTTNSVSKSKPIASSRPRDTSVSKTNLRSTLQSPTTASRMRSRTPSRTSSTTSPTSSTISPPPSTASSNTTATLKTDVNAIRDRYRTQKRMNFFARHTPIATANGSPVANSTKSPESSMITNEKKPNSPPLSSTITSNKNFKNKTPPSAIDLSSPSAHLSHSSKHRQRAISMLSTTSGISDVLNQDVLLEDDNCSLKSDDLMCDYDETLTIDTVSRNDRTESCSSISIVIDSTKKSTTSKDNKTNLRESLDELNRLNNRNDNEQNRKHMTRSVSLKPPTNYLPPLEDAEQITMDIESYRQVMKDVMVVKTVLHQLDRLLKHSDGANMTDSMIGSLHEFHETILNPRRYSTCLNDGNLRNSIDENSSYDDLLKEIIALRKEKEQDKQTIKLLQEQMYKYSSQNNG